MNATPGTIPKSAPAHPRRPPAHKSVSLRHSPPASSLKGRPAREDTNLSSPTLASDKANPPSTASPKLLSNKHSSGESSDAGRWFEATNNDAKQTSSSFVDNDPPFFLRNSSSSETPPDANNYAHPNPAIPFRPNRVPLGTDGSSTEDFRSVIDDLTVANKKLKQKLRKYEKLYDAHLQEEKLFEVRFHGLPDHKKKELEETLRKFASELDDGQGTDYPQISSFTPALEAHNSASSTSRFAESGYASMSASGHNSALSISDRDRRKMTKSAYSRQQQTIQSYLHDIPIGLLPKNNNVTMTDKSKKKLVVRRLEQIFAGKRSVPGSHPQPLQQEEVAQSAATADREQREATGAYYRPEGLREARIMSGQHANDDDAASHGEALQGLRPSLHVEEHDFAGSSPDQRPTRPLDLDPHRAQVPTENMNYIRHLGFTPPDVRSGQAPEVGHGWIYLNLLINMAQLHTLSVTPEFVKDALHEYSSHLDMSRDGRKIRWKGGRDVTKHSGESSSEHHSNTSSHVDGSASPSKRMKIGGNTSDKLAYKPLFFHKDDSEDDEEFYGFDVESSGNFSHQPQPAGNSSGFSSSIMQSSSSKPRRDDGPMIFYTKAKFCTDLSGDRLGAFLANPGAYKTVTSHPIGVTSASQSSSRRLSDIAEPRGPLDASPMDIDSVSGTRTVSSGDEFGFSPEALTMDSGNNSPELVNFEASGLGGVQPEDNFSIHVRRAQMPTVPSRFAARRRSSLYPKKIQDALSKQASPKTTSPRPRPHRVIKEEIISASCKSLPSSILPPASFLPFDSTSSGDVDSDLDSDASSEPLSDTEDGPATAMQILNIAPIGTSDDDAHSEASQYSDDSDDGSVDMLATARQQDPKAVQASEREYEAALAERLAEDIPAGSSAATAAGGSGFNSPDGGVGTAIAHQPSSLEKNLSGESGDSGNSMASNRAVTPAGLKRARTSESAGALPKAKSPKMR